MSKENATRQQGNSLTVMATRTGIGLFAAVAFAMTVYATGHGVSTFLKEIYAWVGFTVLAVGFMVFTSFRIGEAISSRRYWLALPALPFYIAAVIACWVFSFSSYHSQFLSNAGADLADAETKLAEMSGLVRPLNDLSEQKLSEGRQTLAGRADFGNYLGEISQLSKLLDDPQQRNKLTQALTETAEARRQAQREIREAAFDKRRTAENTLQEKIDAKAKLDADIARATGDIAAGEERVAQLKEALGEEQGKPPAAGQPRARLPGDGVASRLVSAPACKITRVEGPGGPGTCFGALDAELTAENARVEAARTAKSDAKAALERAEFAVTEAQKAAEEANNDFAALPKDDTGGSVSIPSAATLASAARKLSERPSLDTFEAVARECETVAAALQQVSPDNVAVQCRPQALAAAFAEQGRLEQARQEQATACEVGEGSKAVIDTVRAKLPNLEGTARETAIVQAYDDIGAKVLGPCIKAAEAVGVETAEVRKSILDFADRNNPMLDPIGRSMGKAWDIVTGHAPARDYLPALIALVQELSLLAAKLFWDGTGAPAAVRRKPEEDDLSELDIALRDGDPGPLAAAKNLVRLSSHDEKGLLLAEGYDEEFSSDMRGQMGALLGSLQRRGSARRVRGAVRIGPAGIVQLAAILRKHAPQQPALLADAGDLVGAVQQPRPDRDGPTLTLVADSRDAAVSYSQPQPASPADGVEAQPGTTNTTPARRPRTPRPAVIIRPFGD